MISLDVNDQFPRSRVESRARTRASLKHRDGVVFVDVVNRGVSSIAIQH